MLRGDGDPRDILFLKPAPGGRGYTADDSASRVESQTRVQQACPFGAQHESRSTEPPFRETEKPPGCRHAAIDGPAGYRFCRFAISLTLRP